MAISGVWQYHDKSVEADLAVARIPPVEWSLVCRSHSTMMLYKTSLLDKDAR